MECYFFVLRPLFNIFVCRYSFLQGDDNFIAKINCNSAVNRLELTESENNSQKRLESSLSQIQLQSMFDPVLIVVDHMSELRQLSLAETDISSLSLAKFIPEGSMYLRTNDRQFEFCLHVAFDGLAHTSTISSSGVYFSSPNAVLTSVLAILSIFLQRIQQFEGVSVAELIYRL